MQILCKGTTGNAEFHCGECGQGFILFWERQSQAERFEALHELQETLHRQHRSAPGREAHPRSGFLVPEWDGPIAFSGAAVLGNAPVWEL